MVPIIESIACDKPRTFIDNVPNTGRYVPGIPADFAVEVPALVSRRGIQPIQTAGLPEPVMSHLLRDRVAQVNLELEAYRLGSRRLLEELVGMDPWTRDMQQARAFVDELFALEYHQDMARHFR
jgi:alpha-galactosidase